MAVKDLNKLDFDYFVSYARDMETAHETEFVKAIDPDLMRAFYRGKNRALNRLTQNAYYGAESNLTLSRVFSATNTILPQLYFRNPQPIVVPKRETSYKQAALMASLIRYYMELNQAKLQNQQAVLNAWFFGLGWKKVGYRVEYPVKEIVAGEPETFTEKILNQFKSITGGSERVVPLESKETPDLAYDEGLFNSSESPLNVMLDHKSDLLNSRAILHRIPRTMYELMLYGNYDEEALKETYDKIKRVHGTRFDSRSMDVVLKELHVKQKNGIWILTWIDGQSKPLQYERSVLNSEQASKQNLLQFVPLYFSYEPGVRYPISHMKIATQIQDKIDKVAQLYLDIVSRTRNMIAIWKDGFEKGTIDAIEQNRIGTILLASKQLMPGSWANLNSPGVSNDLPNLLAILQQNLTEIMGTTEQAVAGSSENKTLGQDELATLGAKVRESGMQDSVRGCMIEQFKREGCLLHQYSEATIETTIEPKDFSSAEQQLQQKSVDVEFMTMNHPYPANKFLRGNYPGGNGKGVYDYDMNVEDAVRPDNQVLEQRYEKLILTVSNPLITESLLNSPAPKRIRVDLLIEEYIKTFQTLGVPQRFLEEMDSVQIAAYRTQQLLMQGGMPQKGVTSQPTEPKPEPAYESAPL